MRAAYVPFTNYQMGDFPVSSEDFRVHDACTISSATKWGTFQFLQEIFVCAMYVPCFTNNSGARSGLPQLSEVFSHWILS